MTEVSENGRYNIEVLDNGRWVELSETTTLHAAMLRARALFGLDKTQPVRVVAHLPQGVRRIYTLVAKPLETEYVSRTAGAQQFGRKMLALVGLGVAASALAMIGATMSSIIGNSGPAFRMIAF
ncbi:hypothetical protein ACFSM5_10595 [Lacibacterium aquatile]|uniref:Uncharacterized protein n=1 Tax=Lacibacterium aquatile TaxID=1168082 RepID=A0ABW5DS73_9PROT